jgi:hypothetical protein
MTISSNWTEWIDEFSKTRKVIAVEMQGHGRTADINRRQRITRRSAVEGTYRAYIDTTGNFEMNKG